MLLGIWENKVVGDTVDGPSILCLHPLATMQTRAVMTIAICFILRCKVGKMLPKEGIFVPVFRVVYKSP